MKISSYRVGPIQTNCYLLLDEQSHCAALIDPGENAAQLAAAVRSSGCALSAILLTHGHYDHTSAVSALHAAFPEAAIFLHRAEAKGSRLFPLTPEADGLVFCGEGDTIPVGSLTVEVLHTPGHSEGSLVFKVNDVLFTGDTLFEGSCGRTDLEGGSWAQMCASLRRLHALEGEFTVLPGHEGFSTLSRERAQNLYMKQALKEAST